MAEFPVDLSHSASCVFCTLPERLPDHLVCRHRGWVLAHIHDYLPEGTLVLFPQQHGLLLDVTAEEWAAAAPLLELCPRMLTDLADAQRVYLFSFSEVNAHFHTVFFPKTEEIARSSGGKVGPYLLASLIRSAPYDEEKLRQIVLRYRAYATARLPAPAGSS
jgi:diadenosine tetraphosphate (Ap4A) HIT family hydrolase